MHAILAEGLAGYDLRRWQEGDLCEFAWEREAEGGGGAEITRGGSEGQGGGRQQQGP